MSKSWDIIEVEGLEPRMTKGKAQAFFIGEFDEHDKEVWIWLPLSQITVEPDQGNMVRVSLPECIAYDKGLI